MTPPAFDQHHIARCGSPLSCSSSIGRPASSSLGRAATFHDHEQRTTHRRGGAPLARLGARGCDAPFLARVILLRGQGSVSGHDLLPTGRPFGVGAFCQFDGIGKRLTAPLANLIHHRRQRAFQGRCQRLPSHSSASVRYAPTRSDSGGQSFGYRGQEHERRNG